MKARAAAEGGAVEPGAFGGLYPPRDPTQKQYHAAMKAFAEAGEEGATMTIPGTLSGFHKASVRAGGPQPHTPWDPVC